MIRDLGGQLVEITRPQSTLEELFLKAVGEEEDMRRAVSTVQKAAGKRKTS